MNDLHLGDLITLFYEEYLALYGDEDIAAVAAAATINDLLRKQDEAPVALEATAPSQPEHLRA